MNDLIVLLCLVAGLFVSGVLVKFMETKDNSTAFASFLLLGVVCSVLFVLMVGVFG